jgi:mannose-6-phosphate isomerase
MELEMADSSDFLKTVDKSGFSTESYVKRVPKPWGYELHLLPDGGPYMMKIIHINAGARLSLQAHDAKSESWTLHSGQAAVLVENANGELVQVELQAGVGYTSQIGQRHRLVGITDCDVIEASTPEIGTTWRLEDDYARPDETEAVRADPNRGWKG